MLTRTYTCDVCRAQAGSNEDWFHISLGRGLILKGNIPSPAWICVQRSQDCAAVHPGIATHIVDACSGLCVMQVVNAFLNGGNVPAKQQPEARQIQ